MRSVLSKAPSLFQNESSTQFDLLLPLSIPSIASRFLKAIQQLPTSSLASSQHFYLSVSNVSYRTVPAQDVTNPVALFLFLEDIPFVFDST